MWKNRIIVYTNEVKIMNEYLYDSMYFVVSKLHRNISRIAVQEFKSIGISPTYGILMLLLDEWKELSPGEISDSIDITPSTTTRFLDKLERLKLIKRRSEGKYVYVSLSGKGVRKIPEIKGVFEQMEYRLNKIITKRIGNKEKPILFNMAKIISEKSSL